MVKEKTGVRCYKAAFVTLCVALAFYVCEAVVMLKNSAEVNTFSELLIASVAIGAVALAFAVLSITAFKTKRGTKILFLILAAVLIFAASFCAVYGYGMKGGNEWALKHNTYGFTFDAAVGAVALVASFAALIVVSIVAPAEVRAERRAVNKQKRAEKKAELEVVKAQRIAEKEEKKRAKEAEKARLLEEKRAKTEKLAEEKRLKKLKIEAEKQQAEPVTAEPSSTSATESTRIESTKDDASEPRKSTTSDKRKRKLKVYPFVFAGISLALTLTFSFARWSGNETVDIVKFFLFSAICYQWVLLGIHILRNVKSGLKYLGILVMALAPVSYAMLAVKNTDETRFFVNMIMCFVPYNGKHVMFVYLFDTIFGSISAYETWEYFAAGMAISLWVGTLLYFVIPSKGKLSGVLGRDGWVRYFACALITALIGAVIIALVVMLAFLIIAGLFGSSSSSASSSYSSSSSESGGEEESNALTPTSDRSDNDYDSSVRSQTYYGSDGNSLGYSVGNRHYDSKGSFVGYDVGNRHYDSNGNSTGYRVGNTEYDSDGNAVGYWVDDTFYKN